MTIIYNLHRENQIGWEVLKFQEDTAGTEVRVYRMRIQGGVGLHLPFSSHRPKTIAFVNHYIYCCYTGKAEYVLIGTINTCILLEGYRAMISSSFY